MANDVIFLILLLAFFIKKLQQFFEKKSLDNLNLFNQLSFLIKTWSY